jgi:hypothetical protein
VHIYILEEEQGREEKEVEPYGYWCLMFTKIMRHIGASHMHVGVSRFDKADDWRLAPPALYSDQAEFL